jgi:hypothetical protein
VRDNAATLKITDFGFEGEQWVKLAAECDAGRQAEPHPNYVGNHPRESSDNPRLNAFWRVAPSLRLRLLAIFLAGVLLRAADFNSRTSPLVQGRRFEFLLATERFSQSKKCAYSWKCFQTKVFVNK